MLKSKKNSKPIFKIYNSQNVLMNKKLLIIAVLASITSCSGDVKDTLGMRKSAPDEFVVISNPPLSVPPQFDLPDPNSDEVIKAAPTQTDKKVENKSLSKDELKFIDSLGAKLGGTEAKKLVEKEHLEKQKKEKNKGVVSKTISKISGGSEDPVINPVSERDRLKENKEQGKPITEGNVKNKDESTLKKILN